MIHSLIPAALRILRVHAGETVREVYAGLHSSLAKWPMRGWEHDQSEIVADWLREHREEVEEAEQDATRKQHR